MFFSVARLPSGSAEQLASFDALMRRWGEGVSVWIDLEAPDEGAVRALDSIINLDDAALADALSGEQRPRIDEYSDHIFLVVYTAAGLNHAGSNSPPPGESAAPVVTAVPGNSAAQRPSGWRTSPPAAPGGGPAELDLRKLAIFCGERFLVTVHTEPVPAVRVMRERCARHGAQILGQGVDYLLYLLIDSIVDGFVQVGDAYELRLEQLEDRSLAPALEDSLLADVSEARIQLLELRRVAAAERELVAPLARGTYDYVSAMLGQRLRHVYDHLSEVIETIDALRERINGIRENYHTAIAIRTNNIIKILTIFAAVLLPLSIVAGIFGMNVPYDPLPARPALFWIILAGMAVFAASSYWYLRRRYWV